MGGDKGVCVSVDARNPAMSYGRDTFDAGNSKTLASLEASTSVKQVGTKNKVEHGKKTGAIMA